MPDDKILNAKILIVDDSILNIQILKRILTEAGFTQLITTTDSTQTIELYQEHRPDLLLLDINMPNLDGFGVIHALRALGTEDYLPILILTSEEDEGVRTRALQEGAKDFLKKPYDRIEVVLRSRNLIEVRLLNRQIKEQNLSLESQVNQRTHQLKETQLEVVQRLAYAAEMRDTDTGAHIQRMSRYCEAIARAIGFTPEQCELVLSASTLHDIGKIAIPDSILLKPGKLTPEEYEIMKSHVAHGAKILSGSKSDFLKMAETIAISHHEKYDGTGYPNKLAGDDIPVVGRICAIADVFDALTSERPYKKAWPNEEAVAEINKGKGTHFDPKLVDAFNGIQKDIKVIYEQYL